MQHFIYPAPIPAPLPPPTSGRGTILSQEARLHALQIAEEIQAERGSYRKWNEVAKEVNRQFGSNVDGDLVKRQVTSMLRSVQRSGLNSVKRPRKHAEVIQQLLQEPVKRQCVESPTSPSSLALTGGERKEGEDGSIITVDGEERTGEESDRTPDATSPTGEARAIDAGVIPTEGVEGTTVPAVEGEAGTTTTTTTTTESEKVTEKPKSRLLSRSSLEGSLERVHRKSMEMVMPKPIPVAPRIVPGMTVEDVANLITRVLPEVDASFVRAEDIDGNAFVTLTHKDLTDFGISTYGKRNKLLQLANPPEPQVGAPIGQEYFFGRIPATTFPGPYMETKTEGGDKSLETRDAAEKKPPVTKILDMEVVGVRKRYLIERENGSVEVLTPCKLRKYKNLTTQYEHLHPDKLAPIPSFSPNFSHAQDDAAKGAPATPTTPTTGGRKSGKGSPQGYLPPGYYHPMYYPSGGPFPVIGPPNSGGQGNLQWVSTPYPAPASSRAPEKYHSFHPYTPPTPPK